MLKEGSGKTRSEISRDWQERALAKGLISVRVWVPRTRRQDLLEYTATIRHEEGVLLSYEEKRLQKETAPAAQQPEPKAPESSPKKLSRKQRKAEKA